MNYRKLLSAGAVASALAIAACGSDEPQEDGVSSTGAPAGAQVDRAFAQAMIPHHESAVEMAQIAQVNAESEFVKSLAADIVRTQNSEIETLRTQDRELADAGVPTGDLGMEHEMMGMDDDPSMLEDADPFDRAFIEMMIPHHEGAIEMAKVELEQGSDPELKSLAHDIIDAQEREIAEMEKHMAAPAGDDGAHHSG